MADIQIPITANGTTTLATAGKFCDRNIAVAVNVPSLAEELAAQKAEKNSILSRSVIEIYNDEITTLGEYALYANRSMTKAVFPNVTVAYYYSLGACSALKHVEFHRQVTLHNSIFQYSQSIEKLVLRSQTRCSLGSATALANSSFANGTGYIYVPDDLVDLYKVSNNWVTYASQIKPLSELEE
ncbi:MAG: hypothetical protein E7462_06600 [Ruminococcaceae bacterium]|nr:hypothetical protein [Oscillospiraceae bacterium]